MASATINPNSFPFFRYFRSVTALRAEKPATAATTATTTAAPKDIPATLTITRLDLADGITTVMQLAGDLGPRTYLRPVAVAQAAYAAGRTQLIVDMAQVERISLSGLFALHSMACVFDGCAAPDPEHGIAGFRNAVDTANGKAPANMRLVNVTPAVAKTIAGTFGATLLPVAEDIAAARAAMSGSDGATSAA